MGERTIEPHQPGVVAIARYEHHGIYHLVRADGKQAYCNHLSLPERGIVMDRWPGVSGRLICLNCKDRYRKAIEGS